jgi:N-methylhydantoinase A
LANEKMTEALRLISVQKGIDPKGFALCCFGGAGGLHLCDLAENLEINRAVVPPEAGVFSALGMLAARPGRELSVALEAGTTQISKADLDQGFETLIENGTAALRAEGVTPERKQRTLDLRYQGQTHALGVAFRGTFALAKADFEALHKKRYGHTLDSQIELVSLRVRLEALSQFSEAEILSKTTRVKDAPLSQSKTIKPDPEGIPWKGRETLALGEQYPGPLIVSDEHTSVWIKLGWTIEKEASGLLELRRLPSPES